MGNELKRDVCPPKYCAKGSVIKDTIPSVLALVVVALYSGNLFRQSGMDIAVTLMVEILFVALLYGFVFLMMKGIKKRLAETYISVCEEGVQGICSANGFKNKSFALAYGEITKMTVKGERLFLYSAKGTVALTLTDVPGIAQAIREKNPAL